MLTSISTTQARCLHGDQSAPYATVTDEAALALTMAKSVAFSIDDPYVNSLFFSLLSLSERSREWTESATDPVVPAPMFLCDASREAMLSDPALSLPPEQCAARQARRPSAPWPGTRSLRERFAERLAAEARRCASRPESCPIIGLCFNIVADYSVAAHLTEPAVRALRERRRLQQWARTADASALGPARDLVAIQRRAARWLVHRGYAAEWVPRTARLWLAHLSGWQGAVVPRAYLDGSQDENDCGEHGATPARSGGARSPTAPLPDWAGGAAEASRAEAALLVAVVRPPDSEARSVASARRLVPVLRTARLGLTLAAAALCRADPAPDTAAQVVADTLLTIDAKGGDGFGGSLERARADRAALRAGIAAVVEVVCSRVGCAGAGQLAADTADIVSVELSLAALEAASRHEAGAGCVVMRDDSPEPPAGR
jgi:hypothetical protein